MRLRLAWPWGAPKAEPPEPGKKIEERKDAANGGPAPVPFFRSAHFVAYLDDLGQRLGPGKCVALTGWPGVGKTYLAREYAKASGARCIEITAGKPGEIRRTIAARASEYLLDMPEEEFSLAFDTAKNPDAAAESILQAFVEVLGKNEDWLIVLDNMDGYFTNPAGYRAVRGCFPREHRGRILITTRDPTDDIWDQGIEAIEVGRMDAEEGAEFLLKRAGLGTDHPARRTDAREICERVDGLPLALDQAAAYVRFQLKSGAYTLGEYLKDYERTKSPVRKHAQGISHVPVYRTFELPFRALERGTETEQLVTRLLRTCAFLDPDDIPLELLETLHPAAGAVSEAVRTARNLRLLEYGIAPRTISLHRAVRDVLKDILAEEDDADRWRRQAMSALEDLLSDARRIPRLHRHVVAQDRTLAKSFPAVQAYLDGLGVLELLKQEKSWEMLVFGPETPSYQAMRRLEKETYRETVRRRMAATRRVLSEEDARTVFVCAYLVVHYWWDNYLEGDHIADPLLEIWEQTDDSDADAELIRALGRLQKAYPPVRDYKERIEPNPEMISRWNEVGRAVRAVREELNLALPPGETATSAERYARGITNIYLAEALRHGRGLEGYVYPDNAQIPPLYAEAEALFQQNGDDFHQIWARWEAADFHREAGRRCRRHAEENPRTRREYGGRAAGHFEKAREKCREGLHHAIKRAEQDEIDAEVIAGFYATLADLEWETSGEAAAAAGCRWAACCVAYAYVLSEGDVYSVSRYEEQVERTLDWLLEVIGAFPDEAASLCRFFRECWGEPVPDTLPAPDRDALRGGCFPKAPELIEAGDGVALTDADREAITSLVRALPGRIAGPRRYPLPDTFAEVAGLLQAQWTDGDDAAVREIASVRDPAWEGWKSIYHDSFPESERMTEEYFRGVLEQKAAGGAPDAHLLVLSAPGAPERVIGMAYYEIDAELRAGFLWYVATQSGERGRGYGAIFYSDIVRRLKEEGVTLLLFEVDMPERGALAERRIAWYRRQGALLLGGVRYFQSVDAPVDPTEMHVMAHPFVSMTAEQVFAVASRLFGSAIQPIGPPTLQ